MKFLFIAAFTMLGFSSFAQNAGTPNKSLQQLLTYYLDVKNALVKDNPNKAGASAKQLSGAIKTVNAATLTAAGQKAFTSVKESLQANADHIASSNKTDHQREHFAGMSQAMSTLVQSASLSDLPVYLDYCPMKKSYWLSSEKAIQNPYYGKEMPDCGNVEKTFMPGDGHSMQMDDKLQMNDSTTTNGSMSRNKMHQNMDNMQMKDSGSSMHSMKDKQMEPGMDMNAMNDMSGMNMPMGNMSHSFSLNLPMSRNGSGTAWSPDAAPMYGHMYHSKNWMYMLHYGLFIRYNKQDVSNKGIRGDEMADAPNWLMFMGQRKVGEKGLFRFGTMFSLDAVITGQRGYPLLFQSGESAHGVPLIDRQHPHDLFSELSVAYSYALSKKTDVFAYVGYPGEPALGPVAFMHRASALYNPDAPVSHHWIDATHITYGVATIGVRSGNFKLEGSSFTGREPNENRYNLDKPRFDSWSSRVSFNPSKNWALQVSHGYIKSPEALHPDENVNRTTASVEYSLPLKNDNWFNATAVWGLNKQKNEDGENAALLEASYRIKKLALFSRYEFVQKSTEELALDETFYGNTLFPVNMFTVGFNYDVLNIAKTRIAVGSQFSLYKEDKNLYRLYGKNPAALEVYVRIYPGLMKM